MAKDAYKKGMKTRRKVLGDEWVDKALASTTPFNADFQDYITRNVWDAIWNREGLDHRVRRMLVVAMTLAQGRWEEFRLHVRAALKSGDLDEGDLEEVLLQAAAYCGVPAANTAFREARTVLDELAATKKAGRKKRR